MSQKFLGSMFIAVALLNVNGASAQNTNSASALNINSQPRILGHSIENLRVMSRKQNLNPDNRAIFLETFIKLDERAALKLLKANESEGFLSLEVKIFPNNRIEMQQLDERVAELEQAIRRQEQENAQIRKELEEAEKKLDKKRAHEAIKPFAEDFMSFFMLMGFKFLYDNSGIMNAVLLSALISLVLLFPRFGRKTYKADSAMPA